jgi:IclR family pca regulon transcriptional regulator
MRNFLNEYVNSLQRGMQILEAFTAAEPRLRLQQLTFKTELPKTTVFRFLRTLTSLNYLHFDLKTKTYSLGPRVMSLGFTVLSTLDLRDAALPHLEELSRISDQNVNLGILDKTEVVYVERIKRRRILNIDLHVGSRLDLYQSSIGRAILAFLAEDEFRRIFGEIMKDREARRRVGPGGKQLLKKLEEARRKGYALNDEEMIPGLRAIGAPVFNYKGIVEGAINMPVFSAEVSLRELTERYLPLLLDTAKKISATRGFMK